MQKEELSEKTLASENSCMTEKYLKLSLKNEKNRFHQVSSQQQALTTLSIRLRMENADLRANIKQNEAERDGIKSELSSLCEFHNDMMSQKNQIITENLCTIAKLQCMVSELEARQAELEDALTHEKTRSSDIKHTADQMFSALEEERSKCENYKRRLTVAGVSRIEAESKFQLGLNRFNELQFIQQKTALDESTKALHNLQKEYNDLSRRFSDINSDYRNLLRSHTALQFNAATHKETRGPSSVHLTSQTDPPFSR